MNPLPILFVVAVALIDKRGRILLAKRPEGKSMSGLWEFPGGKTGDGETPEQALVRELKEELEIDISSENLSPAGFASCSYDSFHLFMPLYLCREWNGIPQAIEHEEIKWVEASDLEDYAMPPADIPLIWQLRRSLKSDV